MPSWKRMPTRAERMLRFHGERTSRLRVVPTSVQQAPELMRAIEHMDDADHWCVPVGRRGP